MQVECGAGGPHRGVSESWGRGRRALWWAGSREEAGCPPTPPPGSRETARPSPRVAGKGGPRRPAVPCPRAVFQARKGHPHEAQSHRDRCDPMSPSCPANFHRPRLARSYGQAMQIYAFMQITAPQILCEARQPPGRASPPPQLTPADPGRPPTGLSPLSFQGSGRLRAISSLLSLGDTESSRFPGDCSAANRVASAGASSA